MSNPRPGQPSLKLQAPSEQRASQPPVRLADHSPELPWSHPPRGVPTPDVFGQLGRALLKPRAGGPLPSSFRAPGAPAPQLGCPWPDFPAGSSWDAAPNRWHSCPQMPSAAASTLWKHLPLMYLLSPAISPPGKGPQDSLSCAPRAGGAEATGLSGALGRHVDCDSDPPHAESNSRRLAGSRVLPAALWGGSQGFTVLQMRRLGHRVAPSPAASPPLPT